MIEYKSSHLFKYFCSKFSYCKKCITSDFPHFCTNTETRDYRKLCIKFKIIIEYLVWCNYSNKNRVLSPESFKLFFDDDSFRSRRYGDESGESSLELCSWRDEIIFDLKNLGFFLCEVNIVFD